MLVRWRVFCAVPPRPSCTLYVKATVWAAYLPADGAARHVQSAPRHQGVASASPSTSGRSVLRNTRITIETVPGIGTGTDEGFPPLVRGPGREKLSAAAKCLAPAGDVTVRETVSLVCPHITRAFRTVHGMWTRLVFHKGAQAMA
ncbi:hypothetical protein PsYK624_050660 [Phanerochaete sordida]|uniref:Uncharacterized protein n=1 Tax=Phanerochaete sordida TaxID=48140 RepID=A0A9P3LCA7_9APHY|nr:hypothetical protein PsYK624_050660 [Phanerochaete sordida]